MDSKTTLCLRQSPGICKKKCGGLRLCTDYQKLNNITILDKQPIPKMQYVLDSLGRQEWLSTEDMSKAYHQG